MAKEGEIVVVPPAEMVPPEDKLNKALDVMRTVAGQIRPDHITQVIGIIGRIADARISAGLADADATRRIRSMRVQLENDLTRTDRAVEHLRAFSEFMTREEKAELATLIIKCTLGVAPGQGK